MNPFISLQEAVAMTTLYRKQKDAILTADHRKQNILCISETFDRQYLDQVLAQDDCVKLRVYYGMDADLKIHAILVGVDSQDRDMLPPADDAVGGDFDSILENAQRCPDMCPPPSALNP